MKKIILVILVAILSFGSVNAGTSSELTEKKETEIKIILKKFINKFEEKNGNKKTLDLLKKVGIKLRGINEKYENKYGYKKDFYRYVGGEIYNLYLSKQDNTEKIVKAFAPGIYMTQNKYGLGYTKVYAYGKVIFIDKTLNRSICDFYGVFDCSFGIKNNYKISEEIIEKIKNRAIETIDFHKNGIPEKINFKLLSIFFYEGVNSYLLDIDNKKIITGGLQNIEKFKIGKSGHYFISKGYGNPELFFVNKEGNIRKLFGFQNDNYALSNYELLTNGRIKLFLSKWNGNKEIKFEKIIYIK